jgi:hypothetical protein
MYSHRIRSCDDAAIRRSIIAGSTHLLGLQSEGACLYISYSHRRRYAVTISIKESGVDQ